MAAAPPPALALICLLSFGCAAVSSPGPSAPVSGPAFACEALRGTPEGLLVRMDVPPGLPETAVLALYRGDAEVVAFPITDVEAPPSAVLLGDAGVEPEASYRYTCVAWGDGDTILALSSVSLSTPAVLARPAAPSLDATSDGVRVTWDAGGVPVRVYRRDVLHDGTSALVSPALRSPGWTDARVEPDGVYAYALQAAVLLDGIAWESEIGAERYIETAP